MSVWEWGQDRPADEWALGVLAVVSPEASRDDIAYMTIGRRNACLLTLREWTLGSRLRGFTECPQCTERLEFTLETRDLYANDTHPEGEHEIAHMEHRVRFRMPNSLDIFAAARCAGAARAQQELLRRCVLEARRKGEHVGWADLPDAVISSLADCMEELDPQAELTLELTCQGCGHGWSILLDVASFFCREMTFLATRLAREVGALSRAYGWREADILAMSPARRSLYLGMVSA